MTITYTAEVATCKRFGNFFKLLWRWHGSIYKLVWLDLIVFLSIYYSLNFFYRFGLEAEGKRNFEAIVNYCSSYGSLIPLSFVLGFFVTLVMKRWWDQYITIPWPDSCAVYVSSHVHGQDDRGRVMRRTVMRYLCVCQAITFTMISTRVKKRFPTINHLVDAGLLLQNEKEVFDHMSEIFPQYPVHWMPIVWAASIITRARKEGRIRDDFAVKTIIDELNNFRGRCGLLMMYDSISIPLVYTQVVTLAVYTYFLTNVLGQQWIEGESKGNMIDFYFPVFTTLQFFFYMGWLKVAEVLINPFGEDDDDFEVNWMIDRNLQVSYLIVDEMHHEHPELIRDQYWDEIFPTELPYADGNAKREKPPNASTTKIEGPGELSSVRVDLSKSRTELPPIISRKLSTNFSRFKLLSKDGQSKLDNDSSAALDLKRTKKQMDMRPLLEEEEINEPTYPQYIRDAEEESDNHFERLREERERARQERQRQRFLQNMEAVTRESNDASAVDNRAADEPADGAGVLPEEQENRNEVEDKKKDEGEEK